jgi:hypothetical protein
VRAELEAIANGVEDWRGIERESLARVIPKEAGQEPEGVPLPEPIEDDGEDIESLPEATEVDEGQEQASDQ